MEDITFSCSSSPISFSRFSVIKTKLAPPVAGLTAQDERSIEAIKAVMGTKIMEKSGMTLEATRPKHHIIDGEPQDILYFAKYNQNELNLY